MPIFGNPPPSGDGFATYESTYGDNYVLAVGSLAPRFTFGQANLEDGAYVITRGPSVPIFGGGTARLYDLRPIQIFGIGAATQVLGRNGHASAIEVAPWGAFKNFTIFRTQDPDLLGYVEADDLGKQNNPNPLGTSSTWTGLAGPFSTRPWVRHSRIFIPPKGTAFLVPQPTFTDVPASRNFYLAGNQMEVIPTGNRQPTDFTPARSLNAYVDPTALNYCENPNGTVDTTYWQGVTQLPSSPGFACSSGTATLSVPHPAIGQSYVISAVIWANADPVTISISGGATLTTTTVPTGSVGRTMIWATYQPGDVETDIVFTSSASFDIGSVMVTAGTLPVPYFDGDSGPEYLWELDGTPGLSRSYYYAGLDTRSGVLRNSLNSNLPMGMALNEILYGTLPKPDGDILFGQGYYGGGSYE